MPFFGNGDLAEERQRHIASLQAELSSLRNENNTLEKENSKLRAEKSGLEDKVQSSSKSITKLEEEKEALQKDLEDRNSVIAQLNATAASRTTELALAKKAQESAEESDRVKGGKIAHLTTNNKQLTTKTSQLADSKSTLEDKTKYLEEKVRALELELGGFKTEAQQGRSKIAELIEGRTRVDAEARGLQTQKVQLETWQKEKEGQFSELEAKKIILEKDKAVGQQVLGDLRVTNATLTATVSGLKTREQELQAKAEKIKADSDTRELAATQAWNKQMETASADRRAEMRRQQDASLTMFKINSDRSDEVIKLLFEDKKAEREEKAKMLENQAQNNQWQQQFIQQSILTAQGIHPRAQLEQKTSQPHMPSSPQKLDSGASAFPENGKSDPEDNCQ